MFRSVPRVSRTLLTALAGVGAFACSSEPKQDDTQSNGGFDSIVYVVRQHTTVEDGEVSINVAGGMGQVMDYRRYVPGARIEVRNVATGETHNILEGSRYRRADVVGLDLSFDAKRIVFSMRLGGDDGNYHIYTANVTPDGSGDHDITPLTFGAFDDLQPIFLAGGRIAFLTNQPYTPMGQRADEYNHGRDVTQIATITADTGDAERTLCSQNLSHAVNLFRLANGKVGFSRWEHLENVNDLKSFAMNPDCTQMLALSGQHGKYWNSLVQMTESNTPNVFVGVGTRREGTIQAGALVRVDARVEGRPQLFDEEQPKFEELTPAVPLGDEASPVGRYRFPRVLPDGRILVSWADGFVNDRDELALIAPDFGLYIYDTKTHKNQLVVNHEDSWELSGIPVVPHTEPPIIASIIDSQDPTNPVTIGSIDVSNTSLFSKHGNRVSGAQFDGTPLDEALGQAVAVRIIEGFSSEAAPGVTMFGLTMAEGAAMLGEAPVLADGSWRAEIPPFIPVHLQAIDEFGLAIRNQTTWIQGMPGEQRVCGGCHEDRTGANAPSTQQLALAATSAEDYMRAISDRVEYPWAAANEGHAVNEIQALLTEKCAGCHNSETNGNGPQEYYQVVMDGGVGGESVAYPVPRLDLSTTPVTVEYDMDVATWPASYVSIFYPAALEMEMGTEVTGNVPPQWGVPSDARNSALLEKINISSSTDAGRTAWALGEPFSNPDIAGGSRTMHPEDVGVELTREQRMMLVRAFDMGGQYYARQNTAFEPYQGDPLVNGGN